MQRKPVTKKLVEQWLQVYEQYKNKLKPNRKTGKEIVEYLISKYQVELINNEEASKVVYFSIMENEFLRNKLSSMEEPKPVTFCWSNNGEKIFIGIDMITGFYYVEDNENLYDELYAFRGLDEAELNNYYCVAEYINCLKKCNMLESVLNDV